MKKIFSIILIVLIVFNFFITQCFAANDIQVDKSHYLVEDYYDDVYLFYSNFMSGYSWNEYLSNDEALAYTQIINKLDNNGYFHFCISAVEGLTNLDWSNFYEGAYDESDIKVQYYVTALSSLLMTMENNLSDVKASHAEADATMKWKDYMVEGASVAAGIASQGGASLVGGIKGMGFAMAFDVCGISIDVISDEINTLEDLQVLETEAEKYLMYHTFLNTLKSNTSDPLLRKASEYLLNATDFCFSYMMNNFEDGVLNAETDCFFDVLDEVMKQIETETMDSDELTAIKFLSNIAGSVGSFKLGIDVGMFAGDIVLKSSDTILRYYEMKTMASAREALIMEIEKLNKTIKSSDDWENISAVSDLLYDLSYVNIRGEYCVYSLVTEDAGLINLLFPTKRDAESWFDSVLNINSNIQDNINNIFPNWDNYINDFEKSIPDVMHYLNNYDELINALEVTLKEKTNNFDRSYLSAEAEGFYFTYWLDDNSLDITSDDFTNISVNGVVCGIDLAEAKKLLSQNNWYDVTRDYEEDEGDIGDVGLEFITFATYVDDTYYELILGYDIESSKIKNWSFYNFCSDYSKGILAYKSVNEDWKKAYINYIMKNGMNYDWMSNSYLEIYKLIDIDGDSVPELYTNFGTTAGGDTICTYQGDAFNYQYMWNSGFSYIEGKNIFIDSGGHMDEYYDIVYTIENGNFKKIFEGRYAVPYIPDGQRDENNPACEYFVNNVRVASEKEYLNELKAIYDTENDSNPLDNAEYDINTHRYVGNGLCDYGEIIETIKNY